MPGVGAGKTILVTGGGGYIGSHCVYELLLEDYNVIAVDNFRNSVPGKKKYFDTTRNVLQKPTISFWYWKRI